MNYLDLNKYGIWLTLSSFIAWFTFFDIGIGNGLRNKFAESKAKNNLGDIKGIVSTAYFTLGLICFGLILLFFLLNFFVNWSEVFNAHSSTKNDLNLLMPIVFSLFCLQLVASLITNIYSANQNNSVVGKVNFYTQFGALILLWIISNFKYRSLVVFGVLYSGLPVAILFIVNLIAFNGVFKAYTPSYNSINKKYLKDIYGLSTLFLVIQLSGIILYSTDNFIISYLFSPKEVVSYNLAYKYMAIASMLFSIILSPFWSSITEAYNLSDFDWIKKSLKNLQKISYLFVGIIFILFLFSDFIYEIWFGNRVIVNHSLTGLMGVFFASTILVAPYTIFLNGIGKIRLQAIQSALSAILNIPLSVLFSKYFDFGPNGVIISTIVCFLPSLILSPIQYQKIVNSKAKGVWNK